MSKSKNDTDVKKLMGFPMRWNVKKIFKNLWNKDEDRIFPPKQFGIGWDLNFRALLEKTGLIK